MLHVRSMKERDASACVETVNHIIAIGGSTAYEVPYEVEDYRAWYLDTAPVSNVVEKNGRLVGFQAAFQYEPGRLSIGTFTDPETSLPARDGPCSERPWRTVAPWAFTP